MLPNPSQDQGPPPPARRPTDEAQPSRAHAKVARASSLPHGPCGRVVWGSCSMDRLSFEAAGNSSRQVRFSRCSPPARNILRSASREQGLASGLRGIPLAPRPLWCPSHPPLHPQVNPKLHGGRGAAGAFVFSLVHTCGIWPCCSFTARWPCRHPAHEAPSTALGIRGTHVTPPPEVLVYVSPHHRETGSFRGCNSVALIFLMTFSQNTCLPLSSSAEPTLNKGVSE